MRINNANYPRQMNVRLLYSGVQNYPPIPIILEEINLHQMHEQIVLKPEKSPNPNA